MAQTMTMIQFVKRHKSLSNWHFYAINARNMVANDRDRELFDRQAQDMEREIEDLEARNPDYKAALYHTLAAVNPRLAMVMRETGV